jgi:hypothetical protein
LLLRAATISAVIAGLDPAIHHFCEKLDHRVTALRGGRVMPAEFALRL